MSDKVLDLGRRMTRWITAENELAIHVEKPDYPAIPFIRYLITPKHRERVIDFLQTEWRETSADVRAD
jgi:hypothetical protein